MNNDKKSNDNTGNTKIPGLYVPQQSRSQLAMSKVLTEFNVLLKTKAFSDIQISAVSKASGVGVGTIYFRFSSKEYLLVALAEKIIREEIEPSYQEFFLPDSIKKNTLEQYLLTYFKAAATVFNTYRYILKPLTLISRDTSDKKIPEFVKSMNENIQQKLSENILAIAHRSNTGVTKKAVDFAIVWAGASLREAYLYEQPIQDSNQNENPLFLIELSKALSKYLELSDF